MTEPRKVSSTVGVLRSPFEFTVHEFTPAGEIIRLTVVMKHTVEPLEDQDIRRILRRATALVPGAKRRWFSWFSWQKLTLFIVLALLLVVLLQKLAL